MGRKAPELKSVAHLKEPGLHFVGGVDGLALQVLPTGGRSWILRLRIGGRRRDMGLGGFPDVRLADARDAAREARKKIRAGIDPIQERREAKQALAVARATTISFKAAAEKYIAAHEKSWKNAKHRAQWRSTLATYAYPILGELDVRNIDLALVLRVLEPIWTTKTETADRLRGRIETVLSWAATHGYRQEPNPARWRGHLDQVLPKPSQVRTVRNHPALPISRLGAFMKELRLRSGAGARALEFAILTAARSNEVRGARWSELNLQQRVWTIPKGRMKGRRALAREQRVPLSPEALTLLRALPRIAGSDLVFRASRGGALSDATLEAVIDRMNEGEPPAWVDQNGERVVPHGFRSTFRDWAAERTSYPHEVCEMALAHTIGDKTEAAYRRGDLFEKRRRMMADWAKLCARVEQPAEVIRLQRQ